MDNSEGLLVIRDIFDIPSGGAEAFAIYRGTVVLDGGASALTLGGRFFFGRGSTASDGTLIISNGTHLANGGNDSSMANFIGVSGAHGDMFMEGGTLSCNYLRLGCNNGQGLATTNHLVINAGELHVLGETDSSAASKAFTMGANYINNTDFPATQSSRVEINGGLFNVPGGTFQIGSYNQKSTGWQGLFLNGGTLAVKKIEIGVTAGSPKEVVFDGGWLKLINTDGAGEVFDGNSNLTVTVRSGGALIDSGAHHMTLSQDLNGAVDTPGGGLIKSGSGTLTLGGSNTFSGPTIVSNGVLDLQGTIAGSALALADSTTFSLINDRYDLLAFSSLTVGSGVVLELEVSAFSSECDRISIPSGATIGDIEIILFEKGSRISPTRADNFSVFVYSGTPPDVTGWRLADENIGLSCSFVTNAGSSTIEMQLSYDDSEAIWNNTGSGDWSNAANWWPLLPADSDATLYFLDALTADATVNVDLPRSVAGMVFDHSYAYTLSGSAITLTNSNGAPFVHNLSGTNRISSAIDISGDAQLELLPGAELVLEGTVSGSGANISAVGGGVVKIAGTNNQDVTVSDGTTLKLTSVGGYAAATLTLDGAVFRSEVTDSIVAALTLGSGGAALASLDGETLSLAENLTGSGDLVKIDGGTVELAGTNPAYSGQVAADGGTLRLAALPAGGIRVGGATLDLQNSGGTIVPPLVIDSGSRGGILNAGGDVTFSGDVICLSGCLLKFGSGTFTFTGEYNDFGQNNAGFLDAMAAPAPNGDGPTVGYAGLSVADGKVILGGSGQTNVMSKLYVGLETTDQPGAETAGEVEISGGYTRCTETSVIGRRNGSTLTAPAGLSSKLKITGGELWLEGLFLGMEPGTGLFTGRPELQVSGGLCNIEKRFYVNNASNGVSSVLVDGGTLVHQGVGSSMRLGESQGTGILRVTGGLADVQSLILAKGGNGSTGIVEIISGGVLEFNSIEKPDVAEGYGTLLVDGGTLRPRTGQINRLDEFLIGSAPVTFDTSKIDDFLFYQTMSGQGGSDGGVIISGGHILRVMGDQLYTGPTLISNGTLRVEAALPALSDLTILPGGALDMRSNPTGVLTMNSITLGSAGSSESAALILGLNRDGSGGDLLVSSSSLTIHQAEFYFYIDNTDANLYQDATYNLINYSGADPDVSGLSYANPRYGKEYTFTASGGVLSVTVGNATSGAHLWSAAGGGSWSSDSNWLLAPGAGATDTQVRFDTSIGSDAAVTLDQNVTLGAIHFNSPFSYTLNGGTYGLSLDSSTGNNIITVEQGVHTITTPVTLQDSLEVFAITGTGVEFTGNICGDGNLIKQNSGILTLAGQNVYTGDTFLVDGTLQLKNYATPGDGDLHINTIGGNLLVDVGDYCTLTNNLRVQAGIARLDVEGELELSGEVIWDSNGLFSKDGVGILSLSGSSGAGAEDSNRYIRVEDGTLIFADGSDFRINYDSRAALRADVNNSDWRKMVFEPGSYVKAGGIETQYGYENRFELHGSMELIASPDALALRVNSASQDHMDWFTVFEDGYLYTPSGNHFNIGVRGPATFIVDGGNADLHSLCLGYQLGTSFMGSSASHVVVRNGGVLNARYRLNWMGDRYERHVSTLTVNSGSELTTVATKDYWSSPHSVLSLDGGTLSISGAGAIGSLDNALAGLNTLHLGVNGATLNLAEDAIITQSITRDSSTNAVFTKTGSGVLTLTQPLNWAGGIHVQEGALAAELNSDQALVDSGNIFYRASCEAGSVSDSSGNALQGVISGTTVDVSAAGALSEHAMVCDGNSALKVPYHDALDNANQYTVACWVWMDELPSDFKQFTFFTTRWADSGNYQTMLRVQNGTFRFMTTGALYDDWGSYGLNATPTGHFTTGQWHHLAAVVDVDTVRLYVDGVLSGSKTVAGADLRLSPDRSGTSTYGMAFGCYKLYESSNMFRGKLDDMRVYLRALDADEIVSIAQATVRYPDLQVDDGVFFTAAGESAVTSLSGSGTVAGELDVFELLAPGESVAAEPGAELNVARLNLGDGVRYACSWSAQAADVVDVETLNIGGSGVVDLGLTGENPIPNGVTSTILFYYDQISGASNLDQWSVINLGVNSGGVNYTIVAESGIVSLIVENLRGTLLIVR